MRGNLLQKGVTVSDDVISQALYLVNKEAKRSKDQKVHWYNAKQYDQLNIYRDTERRLYGLKDRVLMKLLIDGRAEILGVDTLVLPHKVMQLLIFSFSGAVFHMPLENLGGVINMVDLPSGTYDRAQWPHKPQVCTITKEQAVRILEDFICVGLACA